MIKAKIKIHAILLVAIAAFLLGSCVSLNSHQTGRTVGQDNISFLGSFNIGYSDSEQYFAAADSGVFFIGEIGNYYGIGENIDIGLKVNSSLHLTGISKFQIIGDKRSTFASSVGVDIGVTPHVLILSALNYTGSLSLFNSIHPTDYFAVTFSPRYTYLCFTNFTEEDGCTIRNNIFGYSAGFLIGTKHQFSVELSQYVSNTAFSFSSKPIVSLGYIWNIK